MTDNVLEIIAKTLARYYLNGGDPEQPAARWNGSEIELQDFPVWKDHMTEARQVFEAIAPRLRAEGLREAEGYAERLAVALWERLYKHDTPHWKPLSGDLIGILTQIDNMTAGLTRADALDPPPMTPIQAEAGTEDARDVIASALPLIISHDVDKIIAALHAAGYKIICHDRTKTNPTMG